MSAARAAAPIAPLAGKPGTLAMRDGRVAAVFTPGGFSIRAASPQLGWTTDWRLQGARAVEPRPEGATGARVHRLGGPGQASDVPAYSAVRYPGILEGIDLLVEARPRGLEYSFHVAAGADASSFRMRWEGAKEVRVSGAGDAVEIETGLGTLKESGLLAWQDGPAGRERIEARYRPWRDGYAIELGTYDATRAIVVDPTVSWATYVGGDYQNAPWAAGDFGRAIAADAAGNSYVTGLAASTDMATPGAYDRFNAQSGEGFVAKVKADGSGVAWTTYIGPAAPFGLAVDAAGGVYVTGVTSSNAFPVVGGVQSALAGSEDAFVLKLAADGSAAVFSTYLGGNGGDSGTSIAIDGSGHIYIAGRTDSFELPGPRGHDSGFNHLGQAFAAKLDPSGSMILWTARIGGAEFDEARGLALDPSGNIVLSGITRSPNFPVTAGVVDAAFAGDSEAFVCKLSSSGASLLWSTFLGGSALEEGEQCAVDAMGNIYAVGLTGSADFPRRNALQPSIQGFYDAFVAKLNASGTGLVWSTYFGGTGLEFGASLAIDSNRNVLVAGATTSSDLPLLNAYRAQGSSGEGFACKIRAAGNGLLWSTYVGASFDDYAAGVAVDAANNVYLAGDTNSPDFATAGAFDPTLGGGYDAYVLKMGPGGALQWASYLGGSFTHGHETLRAIATDPGGAVYVAGEALSIDYPTSAGAWATEKAPDTGGSTNLDAVVSKFGADGTLLWSTYLGGGGHDGARALAVDGTSHVYVAGVTESWDFPATGGSLRSATDGHDGFVAKLDPSGSVLVWSTFLGGVSGFDFPRGVAVDGSHNVVVAGQAGSGDFPILNGYDSTFNGATDGFVSKIRADGASLLWSTYVGGGYIDDLHALALDAAGNVYVAGETQSADFPVSGYDETPNGGADAVVLKLAANGRKLMFATFLGGTQNEAARAIAVDATGGVAIAGETASFDFPATGSALDGSFGGGSGTDGFVARLNAKGTSLTWSTFLGGNGTDLATGLAVDAAKNVYVTGFTTSSDFPLSAAFNPTRSGFSDAFVTKIVPDGTQVAWSSLLGGNAEDTAGGVVLQDSGHLLIVGNTASTDLASPGAFDLLLGGIWDGFVTRLAP